MPILMPTIRESCAGQRYAVQTFMTRAHKITNLFGVFVPLIGLVTAIVLLWNRAIGPLELSILIGFYVVTAVGITLGFHRMFTHRAFESSPVFRAVVAAMGSMAMQGSVITWVADHRKHHAFTDQEGDPIPRTARIRRSAGCCTRMSAGCSSTSAPPSASASPPTWSRTGSCA